MSEIRDRIAALSPEKRALLEKRLGKTGIEAEAPEPVAIIGVGCRFPGNIEGPADFWQLLADGRDTLGELPSNRWSETPWVSEWAGESSEIRRGSFFSAIDCFDADFFAIAPREAARMDPQQRLVLEVACEALEAAGQPFEALAGSLTGVFLGVLGHQSDYFWLQMREPSSLDMYTSSGGAPSIVANRISYCLGLQGPSMAIDTACSSSLVALNTACKSLRNRECDLALAGGVQILVGPSSSLALAGLGFLAPDGRCKTFDASADGFVRGEGCGIVALRRLSDAVRDNDPIVALVRGTATNQDGMTNGLTAPNGPAQEAVVRAALRDGGVDPSDISFVETHGTGTVLGDPIEVEALTNVLDQAAEGEPVLPCYLGALKTNLGHLEAAAGIAGVIKAALCLQHEYIPTNINFKQLNPHITLEGTRFVIPAEGQGWNANGRPRFAGVSSFGFGGSNAHAVLQQWLPADEARPETESSDSRAVHVLPVSARSESSLALAVSNVRDFLSESGSEVLLRDICYTSTARRSHHSYRIAAVGSSSEAIAAELTDFLDDRNETGVASGQVLPRSERRLVFVFSGQGPQWAGMGRELLETEPVFRDAIQACDELLREYVDWSLITELSNEASESRLDRTDVAQPALFALQIGLAALWRHWGIVPSVVVGHSVGEIAAAHIAGVLDLSAAVRVVCHRARLMQRATGQGKMMAVGLSLEEAQDVAREHEDRVSVAAVNGPHTTVLAGSAELLARVGVALDKQNIFQKLLPVDYAFHSPQMDPFQDELETVLHGISCQSGTLPIFSTVTGKRQEGETFDAGHWGRNVREPVLFGPAIEAILGEGHATFVEISPDPVLAAAIVQCQPAEARPPLTVLPSIRDGDSSALVLRNSLAQLYVQGHAADWRALYPSGTVVPLPSYPWDRRRFWLKAVVPTRARLGRETHPLLGDRLRSPLEAAQFEAWFSQETIPWLEEHRLVDTPTVPAAAFIEMVLAAARLFTGPNVEIEDIFIESPLALQENEERATQVVLEPDGDSTEFRIVSNRSDAAKSGGEWITHVSGRTRTVESSNSTRSPGVLNIEEIVERCSTEVDLKSMYDAVSRTGVELGPAFHTVKRLLQGEHETIGWLQSTKEVVTAGEGYLLHPTLIDGWLQVAHAALPIAARGTDEAPVVPMNLHRLRVDKLPEGPVVVHARSRSLTDGTNATDGSDSPAYEVDIDIADEQGQQLAELKGLRFARVSRDSLVQLLAKSQDNDLYELQWQAVPLEQQLPSELPPNNDERVSWLVLAQDDPLSSSLLHSLRRSADTVVVARPGDAFRLDDDGSYAVRPDAPEDFHQLIDSAIGDDPGSWVVVYAWGVGLECGSPSLAQLQSSHAQLCRGVLQLVQALARRSGFEVDRFVVLTSGAEGPDLKAAGLFQAPLWGLGRVIMAEEPRLNTLLLDLDSEDGEVAAQQIIAEVGTRPDEDQIAYVQGTRYVARLTHVDIAASSDTADDPRESPQSPEAYRLTLATPGLPDSLELQAIQRSEPGPGQVEIEVVAAGLNFRDVLIGLGMYEGPIGPLGCECAGRIVKIGSDVGDLVPGDTVLASVSGAFASHVIAPALLTWPKPAQLTFEQAAGLPIAFLTAAYCLEHLCGMKRGDRVLIHAAAGGVGMAAVQLARQAGAEIFGTAGSHEKRALIADCGVTHVFDSRSLDFVGEIKKATGGEGVDIVLNSLAGDFIAAGLSVTKPGGYFVEIGRTGIWSAEQVAELGTGIHYHPVLLGDVCDEDPALIQTLGKQILSGIADGSLEPLPVKSFAIEAAADAYRFMAQARHIGKLALTLPDSAARAVETPLVRADGAYLITGGLGGLGLEVARWLVAGGARHLVLMGRSGLDEYTAGVVDELRQSAPELRVVHGDVSREEDLRDLLDDLRQAGLELRGIVHTAGIIDDGMLIEQSWERFERVSAAKVGGAWLLHKLSEGLDLDFFVLFSAAASLFGSAGQSNYAAANAFLDTLARWRRGLGLKATSIDWGPWSGRGMYADGGEATQRSVTDRGFRPMMPEAAMTGLVSAIRSEAGQIGVFRFDWSAYSRWLNGANHPPILSELVVSQSEDRGSEVRPDAFRAELSAAPMSRRATVLQTRIRLEAAQVLAREPASLGAKQGFRELGMDSLMSVELRNRLERLLSCSLRSTLVFDHPNLEQLTAYLLQNVLDLPATDDIDAGQTTDTIDVSASLDGSGIEDLADISNEEAERLLLDELKLETETATDG